MWQSVHGALQAIGAVLALQATPIPIPPPPRGFSPTAADVVQDAAHVLSPESVARIDQIAFDVHQKARGEIAVVTIPDIGDRAPGDVALQILRRWGLGGAGGPTDTTRNRGVVILIVPKETSSDGHGHTYIETGYGVEGFITDATAGRIQDEALPYLRQGDYGSAAEIMALGVAQRFAGEFGFALDTSIRAPAPARDVYAPGGGRGGGGFPPGLLLVIFVVVFFLLSSMGRRRRGCGGCIPIFIPPIGGGWGGRGGWGGGGFGGGGFGGGGFGGFGGGGGGGGGGAGRSW